MKSYYNILLILFLFSGQDIKCQRTTHLVKTYDCYAYVIDTQKINICEVKINNTSNEDYVLWFEKKSILNLNEKEKIQLYFFNIKEDFSFYNLIVEKLLINQHVVIFDTFLKSMKKEETFTIKVVGKDITKEKLDKFISEHMVWVKWSTLESRLKLPASSLPWFDKNVIDLIDINLP